MPAELEFNLVAGPETRRLQRDVWNTRYKVSIGLSDSSREKLSQTPQSGIVTKEVQLVAGESPPRRWQYSVYWQQLAPLESHPSYLCFGNLLDKADDHHRSVTISSSAGQKFRIVSIKTYSLELEIESVASLDSETTRHQVEFKARQIGAAGHAADGKRRFLAGEIGVQTTDPLLPVVKIPWSAMIDSRVGRR